MTKSGKEVNCEIKITSIFDEKGSYNGARGVVRDITGHINTVAELKEISKKEKVLLERARDVAEKLAQQQEASLNIMEDLSIEISERKRAENELAEQYNLLQALMDNIPDNIFIKDTRGQFILNNKAHLRFLGVKDNEETLGKTDYDFRYNKYAKKHHLDEQEVIRSGTALVNKDEPAVNSKGKEEWMLTTKLPMKDLNGKITGIIGISRNITERKKLGLALKDSEERFKTLFESAPDAYYLCDLKGTFVDGNTAAEKLTGYQREELIGENIWSTGLIDKKHIPKALKLLSLNVTGKSTGPDEFTLKTKGGNEVVVDILTHPVKIKDSKLVLGIARDVSERKKMEKKLRESRERLRSLARHLQLAREQERTIIAREMHDELGQLITAIKMDIVWIKGNLDSHRANLISKLETMTELADSTLKTVKRMSTDLRPGILDDLGLVAAIEWHVGEFEKRTGMTCKMELNPGNQEIDADRMTALFRVLQEALTNVARHARATMVTVQLKKFNKTIVLKVSDNGIGIDPKRTSNPGSFGLIGMQERAESFGGKMEITGNIGQGTTVSITISLK